MSDQARIDVSESTGTVIVAGTGELDLRIGPEFDKVLAGAVLSGKPVVVDFTGTPFIDSAILQSIAKHGKKLYDRKERMKILVISGSHPEYVLKATEFDIFIDVSSASNAVP